MRPSLQPVSQSPTPVNYTNLPTSTNQPSGSPSSEPTTEFENSPTGQPTPGLRGVLTNNPTKGMTKSPTLSPITKPSRQPSQRAEVLPTTQSPTVHTPAPTTTTKPSKNKTNVLAALYVVLAFVSTLAYFLQKNGFFRWLVLYFRTKRVSPAPLFDEDLEEMDHDIIEIEPETASQEGISDHIMTSDFIRMDEKLNQLMDPREVPAVRENARVPRETLLLEELMHSMSLEVMNTYIEMTLKEVLLEETDRAIYDVSLSDSDSDSDSDDSSSNIDVSKTKHNTRSDSVRMPRSTSPLLEKTPSEAAHASHFSLFARSNDRTVKVHPENTESVDRCQQDTGINGTKKS
jgi:hypothetical protein